MNDEYFEILVTMFIILGLMTIYFLVADLFQDGFFGFGMIVFLIPWSILLIIALAVKAFILNYKVIKRG